MTPAGNPQRSSAQRIDPKLLEILVCPLTKARLEYDETRQTLTSRAAGLVYPVKNGIPVMLVEEAWPLDETASRH